MRKYRHDIFLCTCYDGAMTDIGANVGKHLFPCPMTGRDKTLHGIGKKKDSK